ncbi:hypothetical protein CH251_14070 [Rhodococcus sp. 06-462-5]|uniref:SgcJ/EcaC family oxidoreductase n=1 Tax=unclassified Rhodococcus (in: high G+C Gram-positive bacteria) TaxID=192944 RepID=UPI000B9A7590|nr:hypothetical protein CH251_14070 [Rhodococcus sp. 06-462-5]OZE63463.1 hypothetical protein CH270_18445 [Rhodococcus sp. 02-925g]
MNISSTSTGDIDELVSLVAELERTQRTEDVDAFLALFDDDAVWVTAGGARLIGKATIAAFTRKVLPGAFADGSVRYEVEHVRFITDDVALTRVKQEYLTAGGDSLFPPQKGKPSYLWHRQHGRWLIASGQNTTVPIP